VVAAARLINEIHPPMVEALALVISLKESLKANKIVKNVQRVQYVTVV
jgi:hypothetical protein